MSTVSHLRVVGFDDDHGRNRRQTLRAFFRDWFLANRLAGKSPRTAEKYQQTLKHWERLTDNPYLEDLTSEHVAKFTDALRHCRVKRGRFSRQVMPLAHDTRGSILRQLRALLRGAADARVTAERITVPIETPHYFPHNCLTLEQLRLVVAEARSTPGFIGEVRARDWWTLAYALGFYGRCRQKEAHLITWDCVVPWRGLTALNIPAGVAKQKKPRRVICHRLLAAALDAVPRVSQFVLPLPTPTHAKISYRGHLRFQKRLGINPVCTWHSLRSSFAEELTLLGAQQSLEASRDAFGHSSAKTTGHYLTVANVLIHAMPDLW